MLSGLGNNDDDDLGGFGRRQANNNANAVDQSDALFDKSMQ